MSAAAATVTSRALDVAAIRKDFPILARRMRGGKVLTYLDSAATSQKPSSVIESLSRFYRESNANIHRGVHQLSEEATDLYEKTRGSVAKFLGETDPSCVVFTPSTTASINLVAHGWAATRLKVGDEVIVTEMEHHSNLVPWQMAASARGFTLKMAPVSEDLTLDLDAYRALLSPRTKLVAVTHASNVTGIVNPVRLIADAAHAVGAYVLVDGAQSVPHQAVAPRLLGADFFAFSAHKMLGPAGVGVLWATKESLAEIQPVEGGGGMIKQVFADHFTPGDIPERFEAGTPDFAGVAAFDEAIQYLTRIGMDVIEEHGQALCRRAFAGLSAIPGVRVFGNADPLIRNSAVSFDVDGVHPHDVGQYVDAEGIAIRVGHHCCQPLMRKLDVAGTCRASFYLYNTEEEVDRLVAVVSKVRSAFRVE